MVRVIPLFIHSMLRDEPITIYGGRDKTLDFTYVDDCVDGIIRGIEALAEGRVVNQTINLAYGEGNTLVHCAERIARGARDRAAHDARPVAARRGDPLRRRSHEGARSCSATTPRCRSTRGSPGRSRGSGSTARPIPRRTRRSAPDHEGALGERAGWKTAAAAD